MGSFRSTPDTNKHTINKVGCGFSYAVSHMCGMKPYYFRLEKLYGRCSHCSLSTF